MNDNNPFPWWSSLLVLCHTDRQNRRMLLSGPRNERQHRASVLLSGLLMFIIATGCASFPAHSHTASSKCPRIDCALKSRHPCKLGSAHCGPCLDGFKENDRQHCVESDRVRRHHKAKEMSYTDLDKEEIDIDSVIEKQQILPDQPILSVSSSQTGFKSQTDASKLKPKSQSRSSTKNNTTTIKPPTPTPQPRATGAPRRAEPVAIPVIKKDGIILILISVCVLVGSVAVILAAVCWIRLQKKSHLAQKVDYPAFGGGDKPPKPPAAANGTSVGDKTLAQSVQMYHYQHQKQQMLSMGKHKPEQKVPESEVTSDEEEMGGDFTVYECPGLAPTGEMEVKNPLFDDSTLHYQGNHK